MVWRSWEVESPVRTATVTGGGSGPRPRGAGGDLLERRDEIGGDVDGERLQRAEIDDAGGALDGLATLVRAIQLVDRGEKAGERLTGARGGADEGVRARTDGGPGA